MKSMNRTHIRDVVGLLALAVGLALVDLLVVDHFHRSLLLQAIIFAIAASGLTLLVGYAGQISLGQNAFMAVGAYCVAYLVQQFQLHPLLAIIVGTILPAALAYAFARPILRLSGHYLALATLAIGSAVYICATQWNSVTGGLDPGIVDLAKLAIIPGVEGDQLMLFAAFCLVLVIGLSLLMVHSSVGRALRAIRTSEIVAAGAGINVEKTKAMVFALAAGYAGLSGALFAFYLRSFNASSFSIMLSIELLMMVIVGSLSTIWGALIGALLITLLPHALEHFEAAKLFVYGTIMTLVVMFLPNGLASGLFSALSRIFRAGSAK